ncbi:hypothetical protein SPNHU15_01698 [Streptococcus pneumoniae]|nr:hypothetical protein SPNHU15_01698 [Streptococcus pneumoniae]
MKTGKICFCIC